MGKQKATEKLRESIRALEIRQEQEGQELKLQFKNTFESLKPANLLKHSLKELTSSSELKGNFFDAVTALFTSFLTHKFLVGKKKNFSRRLLGLIIEFGISNLVARNAELIREFAGTMIDKFLKPAERKAPEPAPQPEV